MLNFAVGPVMSGDEIRRIGSEQVPYFRTSEFSEIMLENERLMIEFAKAPESSRVAFITGSGTASMEAAVINTLDSNDKVLVVNGGGFGKRFEEILSIHRINHEQIILKSGCTLTENDLNPFENKGFTAFLVNIHETSTGVYYDTDLIADFCKRNKLFLIVDAISSFLADSFDMASIGASVMITGSQKALACPPGISIIVLAPKALERIEQIDCGCMYLNLKTALKDGERGQTPFTPAVGILRQINARLREIKKSGGVQTETERIASLAEYFRNNIKDLPFEIFSDRMSNAVTPIHPLTASANDIFVILKEEYGIWICPNGGDLKDKVFRVGHIGNLTEADYDKLLDAFRDLKKRNII